MEGRLRDAYGLLVPLDYEDLHKTYDPIHQELDRIAVHEHRKFFFSAAECLGVPASPSSVQDGQLCLQDPGSHAVVVQVLEQLMARGERHAPEVRGALLPQPWTVRQVLASQPAPCWLGEQCRKPVLC